MDKIEAINKAREELKVILEDDWDSSMVEGNNIDLYSYYEENHTQTVVLVFAMDTGTRYEFTFYNGKLLEVIAIEFKWIKSYV